MPSWLDRRGCLAARVDQRPCVSALHCGAHCGALTEKSSHCAAKAKRSPLLAQCAAPCRTAPAQPCSSRPSRRSAQLTQSAGRPRTLSDRMSSKKLRHSSAYHAMCTMHLATRNFSHDASHGMRTIRSTHAPA